MILSWLLYMSGITGFSLFQIYLAIRLFKATKSLIDVVGIALISIFLIAYFSDISLLFKDPQAWLKTEPLKHIWSQLTAIWDKYLPWILNEFAQFFKNIFK